MAVAPSAGRGAPSPASSVPRVPRWALAAGLGVGGALVVALVGTGVIPLFVGSPGASVPYSTADRAATASLAPPANGSWALVGALGLDDRSAGTVAVANLTAALSSGCTATPLAGAPAAGELYLPAFAGAFSAGVAPVWLVLFEAATGGPYAVVAVLNGSAAPLVELSGGSCELEGGGVHVLPAGAVDSPPVAQNVWSAAGSSWTAVDPSLTSVLFAVAGGGTYDGISISATWAVLYAPCDPLLGGPTPATGYLAVVGLTSAAVEETLGTTVDCPA